MFPAIRGPRAGARALPALPGADMRIAIAIFVIVGLFLEPSWADVARIAGI
jgi:hypothetical protein